MSSKVKLDLKPVRDILAAHGLDSDGEVQKYLTRRIKFYSDPYTPMRSGVLKNTVEVGDDYLYYPGPYARYQWYGWVMAGRAPKQATNTPLTYNGAPRRGKEWVLRMFADKKDQIIAEVAKKAGGKPRG